ncbi:MAG: lysoplasmalogenase, partial [Calditrichaeota bacterium]|nr:lysoplasmalogenase [Calditrichota bacterium]
MGWLAAARWDQLQSPAALWGMIGAILFVISDTSLAFNRFVKRFRNAQLLILSTYFIAQYLIARSVAF